MRSGVLGLLFACMMIGLGACSASSGGPNVAERELSVFAAASLREAFEEIGGQFEAANAGVRVVFNFAGSQQLAQQIGQGAPADVFASANQAQMEEVVAAGDVASGTEQVFARNRLVVIYPGDNPANLQGLHDLASPGVRLVLAAEEVPVGQYSMEFLERASTEQAFGEGFSEGVLGNVVSYEENVRAVLSKVALGEADAGVVYSSDVAGEASEIGRIEIPGELLTIAEYPIAAIQGSGQEELTRRFIEYVLSEEGQAVLARYGFIPVEGGS